MNRTMRDKLGVDAEKIIGSQFEDLLTIGSKIFFQTHFYPLIKMQKSVREVFVIFKGLQGTIPVLLNVEAVGSDNALEIHCGGMEITNRNKFEKELIEAKKGAEDARTENADLTAVKNDLLSHQRALEIQNRQLLSLQEQQQELLKLIAHDLQEPLRKSIFLSDYLLHFTGKLNPGVAQKLLKIIGFNADMRQMLGTLQKFEELEHITLTYDRIVLQEVINNAIQASAIAEEAKVTINDTFDHLNFMADKKLLECLFVELFRYSLKNRKLTGEPLYIDISAIETDKNIFIESQDKYQYERFVKIAYSDNGLGFSKEDPAKIFKIIQKSVQFNRINMGLAYSKRIVEKHAGNMVAKSIVGKGVGFTIFLPCRST